MSWSFSDSGAGLDAPYVPPKDDKQAKAEQGEASATEQEDDE